MCKHCARTSLHRKQTRDTLILRISKTDLNWTPSKNIIRFLHGCMKTCLEFYLGLTYIDSNFTTFWMRDDHYCFLFYTWVVYCTKCWNLFWIRFDDFDDISLINSRCRKLSLRELTADTFSLLFATDLGKPIIDLAFYRTCVSIFGIKDSSYIWIVR